MMFRDRPLSDLIGLSRQATVLAYQTGAGLMDAVTPTNGALMAILLAAGVPWPRWMSFMVRGGALMLPDTFSPPRGMTLRTPRKVGTSVPGKGATWATLPHAFVCAIRG